MPLDKNFVFSANSLQDFSDCPRRFELKYLLKQRWPAVISQPVQAVEEKIARGSQFHRLARQYLEGIAAEILMVTIADKVIQEWFERFIRFIKSLQQESFFSENALVSTIEDFRVVAIFDFIAHIADGQILIADWKTTESEPKRKYLKDKIQTLLYPVVALDTAAKIFPFESRLEPGDVSLLYWFPAFPEKSIEFPLNLDIYQKNKEILGGLIREISHKELGMFIKTENHKRCDYCQYRSLCDRGGMAGNINEIEELDIEAFIETMSFGDIEN